jgi:hypothetical protein
MSAHAISDASPLEEHELCLNLLDVIKLIWAKDKKTSYQNISIDSPQTRSALIVDRVLDEWELSCSMSDDGCEIDIDQSVVKAKMQLPDITSQAKHERRTNGHPQAYNAGAGLSTNGGWHGAYFLPKRILGGLSITLLGPRQLYHWSNTGDDHQTAHETTTNHKGCNIIGTKAETVSKSGWWESRLLFIEHGIFWVWSADADVVQSSHELTPLTRSPAHNGGGMDLSEEDAHKNYWHW